MKRIYKLLIVCAASLVLLLCSVVGVSAKSVDVPAFEIYGTHSYSYNGETSTLMHSFTPRNGIIEKVSEIYSPAYVSNGSAITITAKLEFTPTESDIFIQSGDSTELSFKNIFTETVLHYDGAKHWYSNYSKRLLLFYSDGTMEYIDNVSGNDTNFVFTFTPKKNVVSFEYICSRPITVTSGTTFYIQGALGEWGGDTTHELSIDQTSEEAGLLGDINNSVQEGTDQITNGWTPNPEKPAGSGSVDDMTDIEQEIVDGSQEGIDSGNQVLSNFGGFLENWREGFIFVIGLFNILFANTWINSLIQIGLALGLIAFILNIAPSIARKISSGKKGGEK